MSAIVIVLLVAVACFILAAAFSQFGAGYRFKRRRTVSDTSLQHGERGAPGCCPVCGTRLPQNEHIKTVIYQNSAAQQEQTDRICHIFGCPYCYPTVKPGIERKCPVCGGPVAADSYLVARMFIKNNQKSHVHVNGCMKCSYGYKKTF